jgi:hypothetical protein
MATYNFELHEKVTSWKKTEFEIEANSLEEAQEKAIQFHKDGRTEEISWDNMEGSEEILTPSENDGEPTAEIWNKYNHEIWNNGKKLFYYELHVFVREGYCEGYSFGIKSDLELDVTEAIEKAKELKKFEEDDDCNLVDSFDELEETIFKIYYPTEYNR